MKNVSAKKSTTPFSLNEPQFYTAMDTFADGFMICSPVNDDSGTITDFTYLFVNNAVARMAKMEKDELIGKKLSEIIPGFQKSILFRL